MSLIDSRVAIVGAGMGGLTCALALAKKGFKNIEVYESASDLGFVGAGIQLAPNLVRVLTRLGCWDSVGAEATDVKETSIRNGASNEELTHVYMPDIRKKYGYPHCTGHRASLAGSLLEGCKKESAIRFKFGHTLQSVDVFSPEVRFTVKTRDGEAHQATADVFLAADGIKSVARSALLSQAGASMDTEDTGQAAYRVLLSRENMASDPEMMELLDSNQVTRWIGEKRHWIAYPIASRTIYNMSSIQPDTNFADAPSMTYTTKGSKSAMLDVFSDFCPLVQRMLNLVPDGEVCEWKLRSHKPLPTWSYGSVALMGDACHPTLPHLNQGAAQAVEDAVVLAEVLARVPIKSPEAINRSLQVYELLRKDRTTTLVDLAAQSGKALHLGEGEKKAERDRLFAANKTNGGKVPDKWASPEVQEMIYSHDCMNLAGEKFDELYHGLEVQDNV
ncbi:Ff.00g115190.m01.CDS01 [Fusarium sp. VM40]|nr:Ff.00g115190.m01.CDS01 [Fusarium sp. VM40]